MRQWCRRNTQVTPVGSVVRIIARRKESNGSIAPQPLLLRMHFYPGVMEAFRGNCVKKMHGIIKWLKYPEPNCRLAHSACTRWCDSPSGVRATVRYEHTVYTAGKNKLYTTMESLKLVHRHCSRPSIQPCHFRGIHIGFLAPEPVALWWCSDLPAWRGGFSGVFPAHAGTRARLTPATAVRGARGV